MSFSPANKKMYCQSTDNTDNTLKYSKITICRRVSLRRVQRKSQTWPDTINFLSSHRYRVFFRRVSTYVSDASFLFLFLQYSLLETSNIFYILVMSNALSLRLPQPTTINCQVRTLHRKRTRSISTQALHSAPYSLHPYIL